MLDASAVVAGFAVMLLIYAAGRLLADMPQEDRRFRERLPWLMQLVWPLVRLHAWWLARLLPGKWMDGMTRRLRVAALDRVVDAAQFAALKLSAGVAGLMVFLPAGHGGLALLGAAAGFLMPDAWLRAHGRRRQRQILRELPFVLDTITLCVEAGLNLTMAVAQSCDKCPPGPLASELSRFLGDLRAGRPRTAALQQLAERVDLPAVNSFTSAILHAESSGAPLGRVLRQQADQQRAARFLRAEKLALEAPVKMLVPLIFFIFPNTFIVIAFPVAMKIMHEGL